MIRPPAAPQSNDNHDVNELTGLTVLVVEDHADSRELLVFLLERVGITVLPSETASEAFELLKRHRPDVIISDIGLPGEDGIGLIRRVRGLAATDGGATPAIALTAFATAQDRGRILGGGFDEYFTKPVDPARLLEVVAAMAKSRRSARDQEICA